MGNSMLGVRLLRTIPFLVATGTLGCGDTHATDGSPKEQTRLAFTNEGYRLCSLPSTLPKRCEEGAVGDWQCTFDVHSSLTLDSQCRYRGRLKITAPHVTLDCNQAIRSEERRVEIE